MADAVFLNGVSSEDFNLEENEEVKKTLSFLIIITGRTYMKINFRYLKKLMKSSISILLFGCLLILSNCNSKNSSLPFDFPNNGKPQYDLIGEKIYFPEVLSPWKIDQKGEFLIIQESYKIPSDKPLIHIIRKNPMSIHASKGIIGEGPGQITDADIFDPGLSDSTFWINAVMSKKMAQFNLYDTSRLSIREFRQPESMLFAYMMYLTPNESFLCMVADTPNKLTEFDFDGKKIGGYGTWEQVPQKPEMDNFLLMTYNKGRLKSNQTKRFFVKASVYRDRIEIFDYLNKTFKIIDGPNLELPEVQISGSGSNSALVFQWIKSMVIKMWLFQKNSFMDYTVVGVNRKFKKQAKTPKPFLCCPRKEK